GVHFKHREYVVARDAEGGEEIDLFVEAAANPVPPWETTPWPLLMADFDGDPIYGLKRAELAVVEREVEALYFDMLVLTEVLLVLPATEPRAADVFDALTSACVAIDSEDVVGTAAAARAELAKVLAQGAGESAHRVSGVGHAHIDSAWLWPI